MKMEVTVMFRLNFRRVNAQELCSSSLYDNETFYGACCRDLQHANRRVYIESPFITHRRMSELLPVLAKLRGKGISTQSIPDIQTSTWVNISTKPTK